MVGPAVPKPKRKTPARKRPPVKRVLQPAAPEPSESGLVDKMRTMAGRVPDMGAATVGAAKTLHTASEFANIYRGDDEARSLSDEEFAEVLTLTRAAFEMAMAFRGRKAQHTKSRKPTAH